MTASLSVVSQHPREHRANQVRRVTVPVTPSCHSTRDAEESTARISTCERRHAGADDARARAAVVDLNDDGVFDVVDINCDGVFDFFL